MICYFSPQHCLATILIGWTFVNAVAGRGVPIQEASQKAQRSVLPDLYEASITELQAGLDAGDFTSVDLVKAYFARIDEVNPLLNAVLEKNPSALAQAAALDTERLTTGKRSALHGIPALVKDSFSTLASEGMNTTAGSFALLGSVVPDDADVVKRLRQAGAIILGKANMSEWAQFRALNILPPGWSARGGQTMSAYFPHGDPCGSSSGGGVATSIGLATFTINTETDGSITCPSSNNNAVGIKPTVGLVSRTGVIPVSTHQDTVGPITRSVADGAIVLSVIAGIDPSDNFTSVQPQPVPDFSQALNKDALRGKRIGVPRKVFMEDAITGNDPYVNKVFEEALDVIRGLGATVIDPADLPSADEFLASGNETIVLDTEFKIRVNEYLASLVANPSGVRSLADLIAYNNNQTTLEKPSRFESQANLTLSENTTGLDAAFFQALAFDKEIGGSRGIDAALKENNLDALLLPGPGGLTAAQGGLTATIAAIVGYPVVTVPLGFYEDDVTIGVVQPETLYPAPGMPFGISFLGTAYSEFDLISFAYAFEQKTQNRMARKAFAAAIPQTQLQDVIGK